jgi:hypothetical protein
MNENKSASMDAAGELPDFGNLLLREDGFPHLPSPKFVSDAWNDAGTKPDHPCLCETKTKLVGKDALTGFQYWNGEYWGFACGSKAQAIIHQDYRESVLVEIIQWREVQP